jgi:hypothetical protein
LGLIGFIKRLDPVFGVCITLSTNELMEFLLELIYRIAKTPPSLEILVALTPFVMAFMPLFVSRGRYFVGCIILLPVAFILFVMCTMIDGIDGPTGFGVAFYMLIWLFLFLTSTLIRLVFIAVTSILNNSFLTEPLKEPFNTKKTTKYIFDDIERCPICNRYSWKSNNICEKCGCAKK